MKTLGEFIVEKQHEFSHATGELDCFVVIIKLGAKIIHRDINKAGLVDILVPAVLKTFRARFSKNSICSMKIKKPHQSTRYCCRIASEEEDVRLSSSKGVNTPNTNGWTLWMASQHRR